MILDALMLLLRARSASRAYGFEALFHLLESFGVLSGEILGFSGIVRQVKELELPRSFLVGQGFYGFGARVLEIFPVADPQGQAAALLNKVVPALGSLGSEEGAKDVEAVRTRVGG